MYTVVQAAALTRASEHMIRMHITTEKIKTVLVGKRRYIEKTELQKWYKRYKNEIRGGDK